MCSSAVYTSITRAFSDDVTMTQHFWSHIYLQVALFGSPPPSIGAAEEGEGVSEGVKDQGEGKERRKELGVVGGLGIS